ncbi:MAG: YceI family protein [Weeksellaceae bacterium]
MSVKWNLDKAHSEVQFKVKHMVISTVSGEFKDFNAVVESDDDSFSNPKFEFTAQVDSIDTRIEHRDNHLKSDDFFNASEYPELVFKSTKVDGDSVEGEMTIRDVTKPIKLQADFGGVINDMEGKKRAGVEFSGKINRKDFGLNWSAVTESGGLVVSDEVKLNVNLEFVKE